MNTAEVINSFKSKFNMSDDLLTRELEVAGRSCCFIFLDAMSDKQLLEQDLIGPLRTAQSLEPPYAESLPQTVNYGEELKSASFEGACSKVAEGDIAFFIDGEEDFFIFSLRKFPVRSVSEPPTSSVIKGPREGFIEEFKTNISMVRRRVKSTELVVKNLQIGKYSTTSIAILYIKGIADPDIVRQVESKLASIDIDGIIDSSYIASFLEARKYSVFKQIGSTEKPDVVAAKMLEGRIAIVVDGSPIVLTVPFLLFEDMQDSYDYYSGDWRATMARVFRLFGALLTVILPGAYVALQSYHYHLLPLKFLITLVSATSGIPFPPAIEMLFVLLLFEILNEASLRMPRFLGISLSVVGAIVLGDTAVKAGLISSPAVLVTALSAIGVFCVPDQVGMLSLFRFMFLCASAVLGFFGIITLSLLTLGYLVSMDSYGSPYLAPFAPRINSDMKDAILKSNLTEMKKRPFSIRNNNRVRIDVNPKEQDR